VKHADFDPHSDLPCACLGVAVLLGGNRLCKESNNPHGEGLESLVKYASGRGRGHHHWLSGDFEWDEGMIGTWTDPVTATVRFSRRKSFQFFVRFNLVEPQMAFFVKSLPRPFAFGTEELALEMKQLGVVKNVNWPG